MGMFFLVAGLLTPSPLARKGPGPFLRDRLVRLGLPFLAYLLLVFPLVKWAGGQAGAPLTSYLKDQVTNLDPGPLWFVAVLLLFSAVYVGWRSLRPAVPTSRPLRMQDLAGLAAAIGAVSFLVRLKFPIDSGQIFAAHVWQWPQCIGLFVLGALAGERGWLQPVAGTLRKVGGLSASLGAIVILGAMATSGGNVDPFAGGVTWQALLTAGCEGVIAVGLSVWLLGHFQRRRDHAGPLGVNLGRAAFGAYVLQAPVLVALSLLVSDVPVAPELKFLVVAPAAVAGSFALSWLLTRLPGARRIL